MFLAVSDFGARLRVSFEILNYHFKFPYPTQKKVKFPTLGGSHASLPNVPAQMLQYEKAQYSNAQYLPLFGGFDTIGALSSSTLLRLFGTSLDRVKSMSALSAHSAVKGLIGT